MRIIFVRHGHPNYRKDCLTELGHAHAEAAPSRALLMCKKGGHHGLIVEPPLLMKTADGRESDYVKAAYFREKEGTL